MQMSNKPYSISYSKLTTFRRCLKQYNWKYLQKYFPVPSIGQLRGTCGHCALANWHTYYNAQLAMDAAWNKWSSELKEHDTNWQILEDALNRYFIWSSKHDTFKIIVSEQKFDIKYEIDSRTINFTGFIDGIVEDGNQKFILENKFLKKIDNDAKDLDYQSSLYLLASHRLGHEISGVIYNMVRMDSKIALTEPVVRRKIIRNIAGFTKIEQEMLFQTQVMLRYEQEGGEPYRNPTSSCFWDCSFYNACLSMQDDGQEPTQQLERI